MCVMFTNSRPVVSASSIRSLADLECRPSALELRAIANRCPEYVPSLQSSDMVPRFAMPLSEDGNDKTY